MNRTVLIVEDELDLREMLTSVLSTEGYRVLEASNGQEAIEILRKKDGYKPNLILVDLMMPGMDGWAFRSELLRDPLLSYIPIIVISGNSNVPRVARSMRATTYLAKPFTMEKLVQTVKEYWPDASLQEAHARTVLQTMSTIVHRLAILIESLLQNAPIIEDHLITSLQPLELSPLITQIVEKYREQARQNDTELQISVDNNIAPLFGDPDLIDLILNNLIENSLATMVGGTVDISVYVQNGEHRVAVTTTGGTLTPVQTSDQTASPAPATRTEEEPQSWAQNVAPDSARSTAPGVGLGLSLIREILASIHGYIELQSDQNGNSFILVLPEIQRQQQVQAL